MSLEPVGFVTRLWLALVLPWKVLFDGTFAAAVRGLGQPAPQLPATAAGQASAPAADLPATPALVEIEAEVAPAEPEGTAALQLLAILQREGRFVDFLQEDMSGFSDAEIGAAARVVHNGCARSLKEYLTLAPVRSENEGQTVELAPGFDAARTQITGKVTGQPPYRGVLAHPGWQVTSIRLPQVTPGRDCTIIAPAQVEL